MRRSIVFLLELGSFTNLVICIRESKIQTIKVVHALKIDCFLTKQQSVFGFNLKKSRKINVGLWGGYY